MKLMIVDDSNIIRRQIERMVAKESWEIRTAANGEIALEVFRDFQPDAVTMDITMPKLDGLSCVRLLLAQKPDTKILVISALADKPTAVDAIDLGARAFILKPFSGEQLETEIADMFKQEDEEMVGVR